MHREENVDRNDSLHALVSALQQLAERYDCPVIVSTHPRTRKRLEAFGIEAKDARIRFLKPFGFHDYNRLQLSSLCTISDSGTISEESSILGFAAVTIRNAIERPEALDTGSIIITGTCPDRILDGVSMAITEFQAGKIPPCPADYQITNCSQRVARLIVGTAALAHRWQGIETQTQ
jgi:UDP-N-acetylglucosamine 2-epimerase (non-hydrolysing)